MSRTGDWILTYSGRRFWPLDPDPEDIDIVDIAHALSNQCRFSGHTKFHYSVAQHSVLVSLNVPLKVAMWGLLHDAAAVYLVDLPRPIKRSPDLGEIYQHYEDKLLHAIAEKFCLPLPIPKEVHEADDRALMTERRDVMPQNPHPWKEFHSQPYSVTIFRVSPADAEKEFLVRYFNLKAFESYQRQGIALDIAPEATQ